MLNLFRKRSKPKVIDIKNYKRLNVNNLRADFGNAPWDICNIFDDVDDIAWSWEYLYKDILKDHLTTRKAKIRSNSLPWMNSALRKEMNLRYKLLKHAQKFPQNTVHWSKYRRQQNHVTQQIRKAEADYWKTKFEKDGNSRDVWKIVRAMKGQKKNHKIGPIKDDQSRILTDDKKKAESFNQYFATVGEKLAEKIQIQDDFIEQQHIHRVTPVIDNIEITSLKVSEAITKRVKSGKGYGPDDISAKDVHLIGKFASTGLTVIQNSVVRAQYPSSWRLSRLSRVWAIPKTGISWIEVTIALSHY